MNRIPLYRQRAPWLTGGVVVLGLAVVAVLVAWLWRPSKTAQVVPAPLAASAPVAAAPDDAQAAPSKARRTLAQSGQWSALSAGDQSILAPLKDDWAELSVDQRLKWLDLSLRFPAMMVDEQQRVQDRMAQWARMSSAERGAARLIFQETRQLSQKDRLEQWEAYQGLDPEEKKELAVKAQAATQVPAVPKRSDNSGPVPKSNAGAAESVAAVGVVARPVGGTLVQAPVGATTRLVTQVPTGPAAVAGGPKIATQAGAVDPVTLLPQARASRPAGSTEPSAGSADESIPPASADTVPTAPTLPAGPSTVPSGGTP